MTQTSRPPTDEALEICENCGAWVRPDRARCPWCGIARGNGSGPRPIPQVESHVSASAPADAALATQEVEPLPLPQARSARFWTGAFLLAGFVVVLTLASLGALGAYQGLRDRSVKSREAAIAHFERGQELLAAGQYELAAASFEEAVRLEPEFEAAHQGLAAAETAQDALTGTPMDEILFPTATPEPRPPELLWEQAQAAVEASDWEEAARLLEQLRSLDPAFRAGELEPLLFDVHMRAGTLARDNGDFVTAIRHFDQALAIRPDSKEAAQERKLAAGYNAGLDAMSRGEWERAVIEFGGVYDVDPEYLDVTEQLATAYVQSGNAYWEREIWCEASEEYQAALELTWEVEAAERQPDAEERCEEREVASLPPTRTPPDETEPDETEAEETEAEEPGFDLEPTTPPVEEPTATPFVEPTLEPTLEPTIEPTILPAPVPTIPPTPEPSPYMYVLNGVTGQDIGPTCPAPSIRGTVVGVDGSPLAGVAIRAIDEWGNVYTGVSKQDPPGAYDMPVTAVIGSYQVLVIENEAPLSAAVLVRYSEAQGAQNAVCHVLNWRRVR